MAANSSGIMNNTDSSSMISVTTTTTTTTAGGGIGGNVSETESETSSLMGDVGGGGSSYSATNFVGGIDSAASFGMKPPSPASREQLAKRVESLIQENRVLKVEVETYKLRNRSLLEENRTLRQASVLIQAKAEQEEEFISNTLLKQIQELKKEKEALALTYEQEEECLTNDLSRKLIQLKSEKAELVTTLKQEQETMVSRLLKRIKKLESETIGKQQHLEQLRREKVELENTLEQEQEALVNRLWKRMDKLEQEKRHLQDKLETSHSAPPSPMDTSSSGANNDGQHSINADSTTNGASVAAASVASLPRHGSSTDATNLTRHIQHLRNEVTRLKQQLKNAQMEGDERMQSMAREEQNIREENIRLQRRLQLEMERREQLCKNLSESESSLEMEDERHFNESQSMHGSFTGSTTTNTNPVGGASSSSLPPYRSRTISSPLAASSISASGNDLSSIMMMGRSTSPASAMIANLTNPPTPPPQRCVTCGSLMISFGSTPQALAASSPANTSYEAKSSTVVGQHSSKSSDESEKVFLRPSNPPTPKSSF